MSYTNKRVSVYLCVLIVFTAVFGAVHAENVCAAGAGSKYELVWEEGSTFDNEDKVIIQIAEGVSDFYVGDCLRLYAKSGQNSDRGYLTNLGSAQYTSSNSGVITVSKKTGKVNAKKTGKAVIKVKYKGLSAKRTFEVVKRTKISSSVTYKKNKKEIKKFLKLWKNGITKNNRYQLSQLSSKFSLYDNDFWKFKGWDKKGNGIVQCTSPAGLHCDVLWEKLAAYEYAKNPFKSKTVKIKSLSAKANKITLKLNRKLNADDIYGIKREWLDQGGNSKMVESNTVVLKATIQDMSTGYIYEGKAKIKKGSGEIVIDMGKHYMNTGEEYSLYGYGPSFIYLWPKNFTVK